MTTPISGNQPLSADEHLGKKIVGIDLGTTFSVVAHVDKYGKSEVFKNEGGTETTASAVLYEGANNIVVGQIARDLAIAQPKNVALLIKREMGKDITKNLGGEDRTPQEISAAILKKLKEDAERNLDEEVKHVVITIPAYFGSAERQATKQAGEIAGLVVHKILNEPTAAALYYGMEKEIEKEQTDLVYDLGGGTFDITIMKISPPDKTEEHPHPRVETISISGNPRLGGVNWDDAIMDFVAKEFEKKHGENPLIDIVAKQDLYSRCETAKVALSTVSNTTIVCQYEGKSVNVELDREKLKSITGHLLNLTESLLDGLLKDKNLTPEQIDKVLLVGGSTKLRMVREMLEKKFPQKLVTERGINPDTAVGRGAAWYGHLLSLGIIVPDFVPTPVPGPGPTPEPPPDDGPFTERTSHALGVRCLDKNKQRKIYPLILKDTILPCTGKDIFYTPEDGSTSVQIPVWENEARSFDDIKEEHQGRPVGKSVIVSGLPANLPAGSEIEVVFHYNKSFMLTVQWRLLPNGPEGQEEVNVTGLSNEDKEKLGKKLEGTTVEGSS